MLLPDLAKEIEMKLEDNSGSTRTQIDLKPNSTRIETPTVQPVLRLCNASSTYKQMIRSIYENSLDHLPYVENNSITVGVYRQACSRIPLVVGFVGRDRLL